MDRLKKKLLLPDSITAGRWALLWDHDDYIRAKGHGLIATLAPNRRRLLPLEVGA